MRGAIHYQGALTAALLTLAGSIPALPVHAGEAPPASSIGLAEAIAQALRRCPDITLAYQFASVHVHAFAWAHLGDAAHPPESHERDARVDLLPDESEQEACRNGAKPFDHRVPSSPARPSIHLFVLHPLVPQFTYSSAYSSPTRP